MKRIRAVKFDEEKTNTCFACRKNFLDKDVHIVEKGAICLNCLKCAFCSMSYVELENQYPHKKITFEKIKHYDICSECYESLPEEEIEETLEMGEM